MGPHDDEGGRPPTSAGPALRGAEAAFGSDTQLARDLAAVDWAATPLGDPDTWPQSLRTITRTGLGSRFPMWWAYGPELTFFCNDAYRVATLGEKYPWALGKRADQVWAEIWDDIGPRIDTVLTTGVATWDEGLMLFLERSGYVEETYHTFSYSPLTDDDGRIAGMLCVVSEDTERVLSERQMTTLRNLGSEPLASLTETEVFDVLGRHLAGDPYSLPFTATYLLDDDGTARLACTSGITVGHDAAPPLLALGDRNPPWPIDRVAGGETVVVDDLVGQFADLPTGAWPEPPTQALLIPLRQPGHVLPFGVFVVGVNRYRLLDAGYRGFLDLVAGQLAASVGSARAYEAERGRAEQLAELDRAKTTFFTNISHEFRTPLTLLLGPVEDALADPASPLPATQRARLDLVQRNARRLLQLVNTLLDFSRLEAGQAEAHFEPVDLARETADLAGMFGSATERAGLTLTLDCPELPHPVNVDRDMWGKVVLNLLSNALKFTFDGGITVRLREHDGVAELTVADTGIGIEAAEQGHLFERFHRVSGARSRSHEGSGIGLALVAELVRLHQGDIAVTSAPGQGTTFAVRIPLTGRTATAGGAALTPAGAFLADEMLWLVDSHGTQAAAADDDARPRILVADDNADMRDYMARLLGSTYRVETAADGALALELARRDPPDLVLTDVMMPNLDGFGLLEALRADPATVSVPVVMVSARAGEEGTVEGLEAGADDYLVKPFAARELLARVSANLELDRARRVRARLEHGQALLDQAQRLAQVGSWEVDVASGSLTASPEYFRLLGVEPEAFAEGGVQAALRYVHPDDVTPTVEALARTGQTGEPLSLELRVIRATGEERSLRAFAERVHDGEHPVIRGSIQDVTDQLATQVALAEAAAASEAATREHRIAGELQASLLPADTFQAEHLRIAGVYRPGVAGTQVGGDWYDVIELGAGRTGLVMGDVMGRGVKAAAVMGQLRSAVRAYARLDLPPADILEFLDALVRDLGEDQIVTCVYAVYDPSDRTFTYADAGHLPPLVSEQRGVRRLTGASGSPLGTGPLTLAEETVVLPIGSTVALYTDGLVERRRADLDAGIDALTDELSRLDAFTPESAAAVVDRLCPDGLDDDVALLVVHVLADVPLTASVLRDVPAEPGAVRAARDFVTEALDDWDVRGELADDVVLLVSELATNAVVHGRAPVEIRLRRSSDTVVLEVLDGATTLPRKQRPAPEDEHGRGLLLVALLADRWGTRPTPHGKSVWATFSLSRETAPTYG